MLRRLAPFAWPHHWTLLEALALLLVTTVLDTIVVPLLLAAILLCVVGAAAMPGNQAFTMKVVGLDVARVLTIIPGTGDRVSALFALAALGIMAVLIKCAGDARRLFVTQKFGHLIARDLRDRLFRALVAQPAAFHETQETGGLLSRVTGDIVLLQETLGTQLFELVQAPIAVALGAAALLALRLAPDRHHLVPRARDRVRDFEACPAHPPPGDRAAGSARVAQRVSGRTADERPHHSGVRPRAVRGGGDGAAEPFLLPRRDAGDPGHRNHLAAQ